MKLRSLVLAALLFAGLPLASSSAFVGISVGFAPPPLPVYVQPPCPVEGYIWTPGYWAYGDVGYYWVPGVWVAPPRVGFYWTPGYWGFSGGSYGFNQGYWGPSVGFYGGINYGYGYGGIGYVGGEWAGGAFRYNTAVTRVNTNVVRNVYVNKTVINNYNTKPHGASFNGPKGVQAKPTAQQQAAAAEKIPPTGDQQKVAQAAEKNPDFHAKKNGGKPKVAAVESPDKIGGGAGADAGGAGAGDGAGGPAADKPGRKGANAMNDGGQGAQPAGDAGAGAADKGPKKGAGADKAPKNAAADEGAGAAQEAPKAAKGKRQRATEMPSQANTPNIPTAAQEHGRAQQAIANRGPQHRANTAVNRTQAGRRMKAAPGPRGGAKGGAAPADAPNKRKGKAEAGRRGGF
jgi:hypothetical protein